MRFVRLTADAYATFMSTVERQFVPQMPEYGLARQTDGHEVEYVGVVDGPTEDSEKVIGAGLLLAGGVAFVPPNEIREDGVAMTAGQALEQVAVGEEEVVAVGKPGGLGR